MNPRNEREVYEIMDTLADRRYSQNITDGEYYPAILEAGCWLNEFELAERIAIAHPLNPAGAYWRMVARHALIPVGWMSDAQADVALVEAVS